MEELEYWYSEDVIFKITVSEDGYVASINDIEYTFTSFDDLLYGIAPVVQEHMFSIADLEAFAIALDVNFNNELGENGIVELLMK